ncbi:MAG: recombinase family protein [Roseburia sp.]|nr:recombinase family protein [Roseburia sp.]
MTRIRCAIYDRVSTELQVKEGLSLEAQKQALTDYAVSHGYEIVGYYADEGITARKKMQNRKDLLRLLQDVREDKIDLILVTKLDRWFRNIKDYHNTQAILEAHHCNWKTIFEDYDTSTANGRFAINIMLSVNENECDRTSDRINSVFAYKKSRREHLNGKPAYGYIADSNKILVKDPNTEQIVEEIFEHYFATYSKKATVQYILARYSSSPVCPSMYQINRILGCETYTGTMYGIEGYCPAYISKEQLQKIREISDSKIIPHQTEPFLFSSLIKCPVCGKNMNGFVSRRRLKSGQTTAYKRYRCGAKFVEYHGGACLTESVVEQYLLDNLSAKLESEVLELENKRKQQQRKPDASAAVQAELDRLNLMYQKGRIKEAYYDEQYNALMEKLKNCNVLSSIDASLASYEAISQVFSAGWQEMYKKLDASHKKAFWREILREITVDADSHKICDFSFRV